MRRKLATILVADVVAFSRLTAQNEDWTIRTLGEFRTVADEIIARHEGRIFNTGGDSVLAEFASPVEAVRAAVDFQEAARSRNLLQPRDLQLRFRIGINLGDVMVRGDDLLGDGVNIAARLEGLAEPGGICVSGSVWDQINGKLSVGYVDIGEQEVKNIPRPVRAYQLRVDAGEGPVAVEHPDPGKHAAGATLPPATRRRGRVFLANGMLAGGIAAALGIVLIVWWQWPRLSPTLSVAGSSVPQSPAAPVSSLRDTLASRLAAAAPGMSEPTRRAGVEEFLSAAPHRALSVSRDPPGLWVSWSVLTSGYALELNLEGCQISYGRACILIALDDTIEPAPADGHWAPRYMPKVQYSGLFDPLQLPIASRPRREQRDIADYRSTPPPKAIALHPRNSRIFVVAEGPTQRAAEEKALKACNEDPERNGKLGECLLYAVADRVVLPLRLKEPLTAASP
ncbi:MAG: hypothetical protein JO001_17110 [Alphaproteobacteria bacterium]|nr:hypothetical protein [Alphaproteobacteria bacterium]